MRYFLMVILTVILTSCTAMLPDIKEQHPRGHSKIVNFSPECEYPSLEIYAACNAGSQMLEQYTVKGATHVFIRFWRKEVKFRENAFNNARRELSVLSLMVEGTVSNNSISSFWRIAVPIIRRWYFLNQHRKPYAKKMLEQLSFLNKYDLEDPHALDTFTQAHLRAMELPNKFNNKSTATATAVSQ